MRYLIALELLILLPYIESKGTLLLTAPKDKLHIQHSVNQPFINYVVFDQNEIVTKCVFEYEFDNGTENQLIMDAYNTDVVLDDFHFKERLSNIGRGLCGVKFSSLTTGDPRHYRLAVTTKDEVEATKYHFQIGFYEVAVSEDKTYTANLGDTLAIKCDQPYCTLYNPYGDIVKESDSCVHTILYMTTRDFGAWRCVTGNHSMEGIENILNVKLNDKLKVESWYKEEDGYGSVGCKLTNVGTLAKIEACQIISPTNQVYAVAESLLTDRYTSIGTNLNNYVCQLEFPLPALSHETGLWKCRMDAYGAFIKVKTDSFPDDYKKPARQVIQLGQELEISCEVPYSTENCVITSPNGTLHYPDSLPKLTQGICSKLFQKSTTAHTGRWTCHISHPENSQDDQLTIEVLSVSSIEAIAKEVEIMAGDSAQLMFKSAAPISSCRFVDPAGRSYHLDPTKLDADVGYSGRGLVFGDCGISIASVGKEQEGAWSCYVREAAVKTKPEINAQTNVIVYGGTTDNISLGYAVGIPIGVGGALLILFGFVGHRLYKRRSMRRDDVSRTSNREMQALNEQRRVTNGTFQDTYAGI